MWQLLERTILSLQDDVANACHEVRLGSRGEQMMMSAFSVPTQNLAAFCAITNAASDFPKSRKAWRQAGNRWKCGGPFFLFGSQSEVWPQSGPVSAQIRVAKWRSGAAKWAGPELGTTNLGPRGTAIFFAGPLIFGG